MRCVSDVNRAVAVGIGGEKRVSCEGVKLRDMKLDGGHVADCDFTVEVDVADQADLDVLRHIAGHGDLIVAVDVIVLTRL